ncbi:MAG: molybdopterin-binding protein [Candidatus Geothermincolales bacterium]
MTMARFTVLLVGDELVEGRVEDSNLPFLRDVLEDMGMELSMAIYVRDEKDDISRGLALGMEISEVVITAGGLGPTEDDLTAEAVAEVGPLRVGLEHEAAFDLLAGFRREAGDREGELAPAEAAHRTISRHSRS